MIQTQPTPGHPGPNIWIRIGAFNVAMAITAGAFVGIGLRALLLAWMDRASGARAIAFNIQVAIFHLALGSYYLYVAWPMIVWDHPARIFFMVTALAPPIVAAIRYSKGGLRGGSGWPRRIVSWCLTFVLFGTAALTLLRAGFITLKGDRVAMLLAVTGETRTVKLNVFKIAGQPLEDVTEHRVILFLQDGYPAADLWIQGDQVAFMGKSVVFAPGLNAIGFPNLYRLDGFVSGGLREGETIQPYDFPHIPHTGPLTERPSWAFCRNLLLEMWPSADKTGSPPWGIRYFVNRSPYYPLTNPDGTPLKKDFLFDITLDGIPTSRFTSPLEKK